MAYKTNVGRTQITIEKKLAIPEEKLLEYREAFDRFDRDKSGTVSVEEIQKTLKSYGQDLTVGEVRNMISDLDVDGSGTLDFDEFTTFIQRTTEEISEEDEVIRAFRTFDRDNNGWLSCAEFKHILTNLGDRFTDEEVNEIFKEADLNHDGRLDYEEFVAFWREK